MYEGGLKPQAIQIPPLRGECGDEPRPDVYFLAAFLPPPPRVLPPQGVKPARPRDVQEPGPGGPRLGPIVVSLQPSL